MVKLKDFIWFNPWLLKQKLCAKYKKSNSRIDAHVNLNLKFIQFSP